MWFAALFLLGLMIFGPSWVKWVVALMFAFVMLFGLALEYGDKKRNQ